MSFIELRQKSTMATAQWALVATFKSFMHPGTGGFKSMNSKNTFVVEEERYLHILSNFIKDMGTTL